MSDIVSFISWYIAILVVGIIAFPISFRFLSRLPGKGYAFSKPLGLLLWGYVFWLLCSLGVLQNTAGGIYLALGIVAVGSALALRNGKAAEMWQWVRKNWKTVTTVEVLFLVFFAVWAVVRAASPEISGTEKPMEQAFINAILNSTTFPPKDPWLSGYAISYYYFGYVMIAMLIRITGVVTGVGYNLTAACWFALTATTAYGLVSDLVAFWQRGRDGSVPRIFTEAQKTLGRWAGILGSFFILIVSNMEGLLEVLHARGLFWHQTADGTWTSKFWTWLGILNLNEAPTSIGWIPERYWSWWRGSRVLRDLNFTGSGIEIIDEFPFFSYLLSDLHPHVLAMPFALLAMAVCLNLFIAGSEGDFPVWNPLKWLKQWEFWLTALVLGSMAFFNTWDFPIYVGSYCLVLIFLKVKHHGWESGRIWDFILAGLTYGVTGGVLFLPFFISFRSQAGGLLPSLEFVTRGVYFWIMFAPLMIPIFIWLVHLWRQDDGKKKFTRGLIFTVCVVGFLWLLSTLAGAVFFSAEGIGSRLTQSTSSFLAGIGAKLVSAGSLFNGIHNTSSGAAIILLSTQRRITQPVTWLTISVLVILVWGMISANALKPQETFVHEATEKKTIEGINANTFVLFLVLMGAGLTLFPEFFYLRDSFGTRMNTIFKFYFQTWMFWGIAAAYATAVLWRTLKGAKQAVFSVVWMLVFLCSLVYPVISLLNKTDSFNVSQWTLDGNAYVQAYYPDEMAAIDWLKEASDGVVAEAIGGQYSDYARVSELTGKQTVLGWPGHEMQWRGGTEEIGSRETDIRTLYETGFWDEALAIMNMYDIRYIYVGNLEMATYNLKLEKFNRYLDVAYQNDTVTIYQVPDSLLFGN